MVKLRLSSVLKKRKQGCFCFLQCQESQISRAHEIYFFVSGWVVRPLSGLLVKEDEGLNITGELHRSTEVAF